MDGRDEVVSLEGESIVCFSGEEVVLAAAGGSGSCAISLRASLDALGDVLLEDPRRRRRERRDGRRSRSSRGSKSVTCTTGDARTDVVVARASGGRELLLIRC